MNPGTAYRESAVRGAHPVRLVVLLYEQMIADLRHAMNAIDQNQVEQRTRKINHAIVIIGYLESSLNKDAGGPVASQLERFYEQLRGNLMLAQFRVSREILAQQITDLVALREAWHQVEIRETKPKFSAAPAPAAGRSRADWQG